MAITIGYIRATERCVQPNDGLYPKRERLNEQYTTPLTHRIRTCICPKFNTLNNFKLYTQSCSRLRIALKCCLSNLTRTSNDFVECDLKKKWSMRWSQNARLTNYDMFFIGNVMILHRQHITSKTKKICSSAKQHQST